MNQEQERYIRDINHKLQGLGITIYNTGVDVSQMQMKYVPAGALTETAFKKMLDKAKEIQLIIESMLDNMPGGEQQ